MTLLTLAANQGLMGGGEVMLLRCAQAARDLGHRVRIVAPADPGETVAAAVAAGFDTVALEGAGRRGYLTALRRWDRGRTGLLWCHGLLPAVATAGRRGRIVHLHQLPVDRAQRQLFGLARQRAARVLVPSAYLADRLPGTQVLANWTEPVVVAPRTPDDTLVVGYLGRLSQDKGVDLLAQALSTLPSEPAWRLLVAGDARFVPAEQASAVDAALRALGDRVDRPGWLERRDFFAAVDALVVPSRWPESFGLSVAEAMSARVPVILSDAGALPEVAGPEHPWVFPAGDAQALSRLLQGVLAGDTEAPTEHAFERWQREFSPAAGLRAVAALLASLGLDAEPER